MPTIKNIIILLILTAVTAGAAKPLNDSQIRSQIQDANRLDAGDLSEYYGFDEMEIIKLDYGIGNLLIADFDGDGRNDIAVANNRKAGIELLLQKPQVGFEQADVAVDPNDVDINALIGPSRFRRQTIPVSQRIYSLVAGDLNSDGLIDFAFYGEPRGLYILLQKPNAETVSPQSTPRPQRKEIEKITSANSAVSAVKRDLSWQQIQRINISDALPAENALVCADIDNDGRKDLILAGRDAVYIVLQKEDGTLAEPVKYASAARILGVDVADLNGDGINDLAALTDDQEQPIHVRLGRPTGQLGPEIRLFVEYPLTAEFYDIDGKPGDEMVMIDAISRRLACYKFAADTDSAGKDSDWPVLFYPLAAGEGSEKRDLVVADVDGDGLSDVVISDPGAAELVFYRQTQGAGLSQPQRFPSLADADGLSAADIDGDGKSELAVLSIKEKAIGISRFDAGRLSFPHSVDLAGEPLAMELTDIDGDGSVDCVYVARSQADTRSFRVIYNVANPQTQPDENDPPEAQLKSLVANPQGIKVIDVDQDGLKDVLVFIKYELPILVRQTEKRRFEVVDSPKAQTSLLKEATPRSISTADVDDKPGVELLIAQNNFARSMVFANGSGSTGSPPRAESRGWMVYDQYNAKSAENRISAVIAANLTGGKKERPAILLLDGQKGRLQILAAGTDKTYHYDKELDVGTWNAAAGIKMLLASLWHGLGAREDMASVSTSSPSRAKSREMAVPQDILLFDGEKFAVVVPPGGGAIRQRFEQMFSYETKIKDGAYGNLTTGDINGDGVVDIILVEYKHNHIEILTLDSTGKPIPAFAFKIFEDKTYREMRPPSPVAVEPRQMKVADVTGDGKADLVTVIHDRIIIYPQD